LQLRGWQSTESSFGIVCILHWATSIDPVTGYRPGDDGLDDDDDDDAAAASRSAIMANKNWTR